jgi:hypothetical protein
LTDNNHREAKWAFIPTIYSILSDEDCVKLLQMIFEHRQPKVSDLSTRKRYYTRLSKLRKAHLITKKESSKSMGESGDRLHPHQTDYKLTDFGSVIYQSLLILRRADNLSPKLRAIDAFEESGAPYEELDKLIETLIPDETIRKFVKRTMIQKEFLE